MLGRLTFVSFRRLHFSTSRVNSIRRISSSREAAFADNLSTFKRRTHTQPSNEQSPTQKCASRSQSEPHPKPDLDPNLEPVPDNFDSKLELHPNPKPNLVTNPSFDASLPELVKRIWAVERLSKGKKYTKSDKQQNRVPGFLCEQDSPETRHVLILMDKFQIQDLYSILGEERFLCTIFTLEVYDGLGSNRVLYRERVLPRRINFNKSGEITNVGYTRAPLGMKLRLDVPLRINGQEDCPGLRKGGFLKVYISYISLFCLPEELPQYVEIHVDEMDIGDKICLGDLRTRVPLHWDNQPSLSICEIIELHT